MRRARTSVSLLNRLARTVQWSDSRRALQPLRSSGATEVGCSGDPKTSPTSPVGRPLQGAVVPPTFSRGRPESSVMMICMLQPCLCRDARVNVRLVMIHPQVHLRIPCYDFYFLYSR